MHQTLDAFATKATDNEFDTVMAQRQSWFADSDLDAIKHRLTTSAQSGSEDARHLKALLDTGSPYSARISLQLLEEAAGKTLKDCLALELALGSKVVRFPDCAEGVRAVLVDKDRNPSWQPS